MFLKKVSIDLYKNLIFFLYIIVYIGILWSLNKKY